MIVCVAVMIHLGAESWPWLHPRQKSALGSCLVHLVVAPALGTIPKEGMYLRYNGGGHKSLVGRTALIASQVLDQLTGYLLDQLPPKV